MKNDLAWIIEARKHIGIEENTSKRFHNPVLQSMLSRMGTFNGELGAWWRDDDTPWCGLFVGFCLGVSGRYVIKNWFRASAWDSPALLQKLSAPAYGAIATFERKGGGHVGFIVGKDALGNLMILGGNQANKVSIAPFSTIRLTGCFWPSHCFKNIAVKSVPNPERYKLKIFKHNENLSENEE